MVSRFLIVAGAVPPAVGGAESLAMNIVLGLCEAGCEVFLLCGTEPNMTLRRALASTGGVKVVSRNRPTDRVEWEYDAFYRASAIYQVLVDYKPDYVWVLSHDGAISASIALSSDKGPVILATFSEIATEYLTFEKLRSRFAYDLGRIDLFVTLSARYSQVALQHGVDATRIIQNPIGFSIADLNSGDPDRGRALLRSSDEESIVLCPSRFSKRKGQATLLQSWRAVTARSTRLVLLGSSQSGSKEFELNIKSQVRSWGRSSNVLVLDGVDREEMKHVLAAATIVVQPSEWEGLGFAALEAMAAGKACVLTAVPGFDEFSVDGFNALVVPPSHVNSLTVALQTMLDDSQLRARLAVKARSTAMRFDRTANITYLLDELTSRAEGLDSSGND